jgi:hypothetical protein
MLMANSVQEVSFLFNPSSAGSKQIFVNVVGILDDCNRKKYMETASYETFFLLGFRNGVFKSSLLAVDMHSQKNIWNSICNEEKNVC